MADFLAIRPGTSLAADLVWQSSLFLIAGLAGSLILWRRPARAHLVLVLAMLGALVTPLCSQFVHRAGWGLRSTLPPSAALSIETAAPDVSATGPLPTSSVWGDRGAFQRAPFRLAKATSESGPDESRIVQREFDTAPQRHPAGIGRTNLFSLFTQLWCVLGSLCLIRLIVSLVMGQRAVVGAHAFECGSVKRALDVAWHNSVCGCVLTSEFRRTSAARRSGVGAAGP